MQLRKFNGIEEIEIKPTTHLSPYYKSKVNELVTHLRKKPEPKPVTPKAEAGNQGGDSIMVRAKKHAVMLDEEMDKKKAALDKVAALQSRVESLQEKVAEMQEQLSRAQAEDAGCDACLAKLIGE